MKLWLKEPLVHFLLIGAALFASFELINERVRSDPGQIVVTRGQINHLAVGFTRTWQRPPSAAELEGLIRDYIREEVYYREALAMGLDKDDTVIRRRLRQKMEFITDDVAALAEPTDDELLAFLKAHPQRFFVEPRFTFSQVYLDLQSHGVRLDREAADLLAQLNRSGVGNVDVSTVGNSFPLQRHFDAVSGREVVRQFGKRFFSDLEKLTPGRWQGPIESAYGQHLVFVSERAEGRLPALAEVRDAVRREWLNTQRLETNEKFYQQLLERYSVTIERPDAYRELLDARK